MPRRQGVHAIIGIRRRDWVVALFLSAVALAGLVWGSAWGNVDSSRLDPRLVAWISSGVLLVFGVLGTTRVATLFSRGVAARSIPSAGGAVRILTAAVGYLVAIFGVLAILDVSIEHLLVGVGLAGVVLGIAAQQSLGNVFAGLVLISARPFVVGDHVRIRSGALGGIFEAWILEMSLTYVTLRIDGETVKVPNSAMLAAAVGQVAPGAPVGATAPGPSTAPQVATAPQRGAVAQAGPEAESQR